MMLDAVGAALAEETGTDAVIVDVGEVITVGTGKVGVGDAWHATIHPNTMIRNDRLGRMNFMVSQFRIIFDKLDHLIHLRER